MCMPSFGIDGLWLDSLGQRDYLGQWGSRIKALQNVERENEKLKARHFY